MADNFYLVLAAILLLPVIPAYILYKYLPASDTDVSGPYQGLSIKLKGAFAGYFLLVIVGSVLQYGLMNSKDKKSIERLETQVRRQDSTIADLRVQVSNAVTDWYVKGLISPAGNDKTRFFYDDGTTKNSPDGSFELIKRTLGKEGASKPPKWICIYNAQAGFRVISLNRDIGHPDIQTYSIAFDDQKHEITIRNPININSIARDSIVAVANFIEQNPALKTQVMEIDPAFLQKASIIKNEQMQDRSKLRSFEQAQAQKAAMQKKPTP